MPGGGLGGWDVKSRPGDPWAESGNSVREAGVCLRVEPAEPWWLLPLAAEL